MELPDFTEFAPFNELREKMSADELGFFELFDPTHHLTGVERSELNREGLSVGLSQVQQLLDFTLVYKNSRVCIADQGCFHIANCGKLPRSTAVNIFTSMKSAHAALTVCKACLQKLQYKGYDAVKARKEHYSLQVFEQFKLETFWQAHHLYPVSEKREMRKPISLLEASTEKPELDVTAQ